MSVTFVIKKFSLQTWFAVFAGKYSRHGQDICYLSFCQYPCQYVRRCQASPTRWCPVMWMFIKPISIDISAMNHSENWVMFTSLDGTALNQCLNGIHFNVLLKEQTCVVICPCLVIFCPCPNKGVSETGPETIAFPIFQITIFAAKKWGLTPWSSQGRAGAHQEDGSPFRSGGREW